MPANANVCIKEVAWEESGVTCQDAMLIEELLTFHNLKASKPIQLRNKLLASLHYNHGMPKQTLAEKMGLAIQTVKRILKAARPPARQKIPLKSAYCPTTWKKKSGAALQSR